MSSIRRIYAYLLAFAGLAMLSLAAANLVQLLVDLVLHSPTVASNGYVRDTVSFHAAAALVGLPVWLVHWLWIGRLVRADPHDRASTLRRLYLYAILVGATLEVTGSARDVLVGGFSALVGAALARTTTLDAVVRPLPFTLIAFGVWLAHWRIAAADRLLIGERGGSATLRRWYVYGAALVGLMLLATGTESLVEALWLLLTQPVGASGPALAQHAADALAGLGLWLVHTVVLPHRLSEADQRDDATSVLLSVYVFLGLAIGVVGCLLGMSQLLYYTVARLLGVDHPAGVGGDLLQAAAGPASIALVYGALWAYAGTHMRAARLGAAEAPRQAAIRRLYTYLVALVALGVLAGGCAGLLWTLGDVLLSGFVPSGSWREQTAMYATLAVVGLPVWLRHWRPGPAPVAEARSIARRLYVYLSLIVAMLALVGSAAAGLYRLFGVALGGSFDVSVAADLVHAVAVACVAGVVAVYEWRVVRSDAARLQPKPRTQPELTAVPAAAPAPASVIVQLHAPDATALSNAITTLRAAGVQVDVVEPTTP